MDADTIIVSPDTPYFRTYQVSYVNLSREVETVVARADALGLRVDDSARVAGAVVKGVTAVLSFVALLILAVAGLHTAQTFEARARLRRKEIALSRALGATRGQIRWLIASEGLAVGFMGAVLGLVLGLGGAYAAAAALREALSQAPFVPKYLVLIDVWVVLLPLAAALISALLGGWGPARRAAARDPVSIL